MDERSGSARDARVAHRWIRVAIGTAAGVAWAAALRAWMAELSGPLSQYTWGTFVGVLLPGAVFGAAIGWATTVGPDATDRERRMLRWCAASPVAFAVAPLLLPGAIVGLLTEGLGGGAILVALIPIAGGYAFGGGRPIWARIVCGIPVVATVVLAGVFTGPLMRDRALALTSPRGAWLAVLDLTLLILLVAAASVPFRRLTAIAHHRSEVTASAPVTAGSASVPPEA